MAGTGRWNLIETMFQTLPGLLTGFFTQEFIWWRFLLNGFKPFQGFLPVSSTMVRGVNTEYIFCFKPFQGFLPVSSIRIESSCKRYLKVSNPSRASYRFLRRRENRRDVCREKFQTLPGLLTGFFIAVKKLAEGFMTLFQTLPGLLTGFFFSSGRFDCCFHGLVSNPSRASYRFLPKPDWRAKHGYLHVSNPSRASYRFLRKTQGDKHHETIQFQTLPGLLTGFFLSPVLFRCRGPHGFQTLPGLLTGFF